MAIYRKVSGGGECSRREMTRGRAHGEVQEKEARHRMHMNEV